KANLLTNTQQDKIYFNQLTNQYAHAFCTELYANYKNKVLDCVKRLYLHQFIPEYFVSSAVFNKVTLLDKLYEKVKSKMYLIKGDKVKLLQYHNEFYEIEYHSEKKGIIRKWIHCSAIDAC